MVQISPLFVGLGRAPTLMAVRSFEICSPKDRTRWVKANAGAIYSVEEKGFHSNGNQGSRSGPVSNISWFVAPSR